MKDYDYEEMKKKLLLPMLQFKYYSELLVVMVG